MSIKVLIKQPFCRLSSHLILNRFLRSFLQAERSSSLFLYSFLSFYIILEILRTTNLIHLQIDMRILGLIDIQNKLFYENVSCEPKEFIWLQLCFHDLIDISEWYRPKFFYLLIDHGSQTNGSSQPTLLSSSSTNLGKRPQICLRMLREQSQRHQRLEEVGEGQWVVMFLMYFLRHQHQERFRRRQRRPHDVPPAQSSATLTLEVLQAFVRYTPDTQAYRHQQHIHQCRAPRSQGGMTIKSHSLREFQENK